MQSRTVFFLLFGFLLFSLKLYAQRVYGVHDSTIYKINENEIFIAGKQILYKKNIVNNRLEIVKDFSYLLSTDPSYLANEKNFIIDFDFNNASHLWVVYGSYRSGLYESKDGGLTWAERTDVYTYPDLPLKKVTAIQIKDAKMYLFQDYYTSTISVSSDEGFSWKSLVTGGMACYYFAIGFCGDGSMYAYSFATDGRSSHLIKVDGVESPYYYNFNDFNASSKGILPKTIPPVEKLEEFYNGLLQDSICSLLTQLDYPAYRNSILIFPNPAHEKIQVKMNGLGKNLIIKLFNQLGQVIYESSIFNNEYEINTTDILPGIYVLTVFQEGKKVILEKVYIQ